MNDRDNELKNAEVAADEVVTSASEGSDAARDADRAAAPDADCNAEPDAARDAEPGTGYEAERETEHVGPSPARDAERAAEMPASFERISPATAQQGSDPAADGDAGSSAGAGSAGSRRIAAIAVAVLVALAVAAGLAYALGGSGSAADSSSAQQTSTASPETSSSISSDSADAKDAGASGNAEQATTPEKAQEDAHAKDEQASSEQESLSESAGDVPVEEEVGTLDDGTGPFRGDMRESGGGDSSSSNGSGNGSSAKSTSTVYLGIDSSRAAEYGLSGPSANMSIELDEGATVYDALCASGFSISGSSSYVSAIGGLAEKQCGSGSGWTYAVNGSFPSRACGRYVLSGGESISWIYSTEKDPTLSM